MAATIRLVADLFDNACDLIKRTAFGRSPVAPLRAVDTSKITFCIGPLVPNGDAMFLKPMDVGIASQEPKKFVDDRFEVDLLCGEEWETFAKRKSSLGSEERACTRAGAVQFGTPLLQNESQEVVVLLHQIRIISKPP